MRRVRLDSAQLQISGVARFDVRDPYHLALTLSWGSFLAVLFLSYLVINLLFAILYVLQPGCIANTGSGSLLDTFFFSIETLATVGYGAMVPVTLYGHIVVSFEIFCGILFASVTTGLIFVRFSKPRARIVYADTAVVTRLNGQPTLMVRIAHGRLSALVSASVRLTALIMEQSQEGQRFLRVRDLPLSCPSLPLFPLTWTIMHPLDEHSPLAQYSPQDLIAAKVRLYITIEGRDPAMQGTVFDMKSYTPDRIAFGMRYADAVSWNEFGHARADLTRLSAIEPDGMVPIGGETASRPPD
jgi:inward rectifier potassium channel